MHTLMNVGVNVCVLKTTIVGMEWIVWVCAHITHICAYMLSTKNFAYM